MSIDARTKEFDAQELLRFLDEVAADDRSERAAPIASLDSLSARQAHADAAREVGAPCEARALVLYPERRRVPRPLAAAGSSAELTLLDARRFARHEPPWLRTSKLRVALLLSCVGTMVVAVGYGVVAGLPQGARAARTPPLAPPLPILAHSAGPEGEVSEARVAEPSFAASRGGSPSPDVERPHPPRAGVHVASGGGVRRAVDLLASGQSRAALDAYRALAAADPGDPAYKAVVSLLERELRSELEPCRERSCVP